MIGHDVAQIHGAPPRTADGTIASQPSAADADAAEREARELQAMSEGVVLSDTVECMGGRYRIREKVGLMAMMRFAVVSRRTNSDDELAAMEAIYDVLRACILPDDWERFVEDMIDKSAEADDMLPLVNETYTILAARPTKRPSASSDGRSATGPGSTDGSSPAAPARPVPDWVKDTVPVARLA